MHSNMFARQSKPCRNRVKNFEAKVLLQIFKVSLAPKIHFTWFMCQAPTKYSKSPLLSATKQIFIAMTLHANFANEVVDCLESTYKLSISPYHCRGVLEFHQGSMHQCWQPIATFSGFTSGEVCLGVEDRLGETPQPRWLQNSKHFFIKVKNAPMQKKIRTKARFVAQSMLKLLWREVICKTWDAMTLSSVKVCPWHLQGRNTKKYDSKTSKTMELSHCFCKTAMRTKEGAVLNDLGKSIVFARVIWVVRQETAEYEEKWPNTSLLPSRISRIPILLLLKSNWYPIWLSELQTRLSR